MRMIEDIRTALRKDPALHGSHVVEVLAYAGLWAIWFNRIAHRVWLVGVPLLPRLISEAARVLTGIEIHPGAQLGRRVFIDHGTGIVIGETAVVGDDCTIFHGVTLGGRGWWVDKKGAKRHPTVGNGVTLAAGCSVLGAVTVGDGSRIGPNAVVLDDVPAGCVVVAPASRCVKMRSGPDAASANADPRAADPGVEDESDDIPSWMTAHEMGGL